MTPDARTDPLRPFGSEPVDQPGGGDNAAEVRAKYGVTVVLSGFAVVLAAFGIAVLAFDVANDVSTALAPITGVIGTIVGAYFGVQVGASGKEESDAARTKAEDEAKKLATVAPPKAAAEILGVNTSSWGPDHLR